MLGSVVACVGTGSMIATAGQLDGGSCLGLFRVHSKVHSHAGFKHCRFTMLLLRSIICLVITYGLTEFTICLSGSGFSEYMS